MALVGLLLGVKSSDGTPTDAGWTVLGVVWAGAIGYGIGSIFDRRRLTLYLVECWAITFALLGAVLGSLVPLRSWVTQYAVAGLAGALVGVLFWVNRSSAETGD